jgi:hypothetical protein
MTPEQIDLARHALGLPNARRRSYRNHFVTGPGTADYEHWKAMVSAGLATRHPPSQITGGDDWFRLTHEGALQALRAGERLDAEDFKPARAEQSGA